MANVVDAVQADVKDLLEAVENNGDRKEHQDKKELAAAAAPAAVAAPQSLDFLKKEHVQRWLKDQGLLEKLQCAWLTPRSNDATLIMDEDTVEELVFRLYGRAIVVLGQTGVSENDIVKEFLPSAMFSQLLGTLIPWEMDAIDNEGEGIGKGTQKLMTDPQIKFPLLLQADARRVHLDLITKLKTAFSPDNIADLFKPKTLLSWEEYVATLPPLPEGFNTDEDYAKFSDACAEEGLFYVHFSIKTKGLYYRVMCDDFNEFIKCLEAISSVYAKELKEKAEGEDADKVFEKQHKDYLEKVALFIDGFRTLQHALIAKFPALCETLAQAPALEGYGEEPITRLSPSQLFFDQAAVPIEFDLPKLPFTESDTVLVLDASGSMGEGDAGKTRMDVIKSPDGLEKALTELAKKPNQFLIFVKYQGKTGDNVKVSVKGVPLDRVPLTPETLPDILKALRSIEPDLGTFGIPGLRTALETLTRTWKEVEQQQKGDKKAGLDNKEGADKKGEGEVVVPRTNARLLLATDGVWDEVYSRKLRGADPALFPKFKKDLRELFKSVALTPMDILGMDLDPAKSDGEFLRIVAAMSEEGSQMVFASTAKLGEEINDLMLMQQFRFLNSINVTYSVKGKPVVTEPMSPFFTNKVVNRTLFVPPEAIKAAGEADCDEIEVTIEITYDDKTKAVRRHTLSAMELKNSLAQASTLSDYQKKLMIEEWIDEQMYALGVRRRSHFNLLSGTEQFDIYTKIFVKAMEHPAMLEIFELLEARMELCANDWINDRLCTLMKVQLPSELDKKSKMEQFLFLRIVSQELQKMGLKKALKVINDRMSPLWCETQLCQAAGVKVEAEFNALSAEKQLVALEKVLKSAEKDKNDAAVEDIKRRITALNKKWMEEALCRAAGVALFADFNNTHKVTALKRYQAIIQVAQEAGEKEKDASVLEALNTLMLEVWLDARLCEEGNVVDRSKFAALTPQEQIRVLTVLKAEASDDEGIGHEAAQKEIDYLLAQVKQTLYKKWIEESLAAASGASSIAAFNQANALIKMEAIKKAKAAVPIMLPLDCQAEALNDLRNREQAIWLDARILSFGKEAGIQTRAEFLQWDPVLLCNILEKLKAEAEFDKFELVVKEISALILEVKKAEVDKWVKERMEALLAGIPAAAGAGAQKFEDLTLAKREELFRTLEEEAKLKADRAREFLTAVRAKAQEIEREIVIKQQGKAADEARAGGRGGLGFSSLGRATLNPAATATATAAPATSTQTSSVVDEDDEDNDLAAALQLSQALQNDEKAVGNVGARKQRRKYRRRNQAKIIKTWIDDKIIDLGKEVGVKSRAELLQQDAAVISSLLEKIKVLAVVELETEQDEQDAIREIDQMLNATKAKKLKS